MMFPGLKLGADRKRHLLDLNFNTILTVTKINTFLTEIKNKNINFAKF